MPSAGPRYHAFISHTAADNRETGRDWADWIEEALEEFEVPPALAGRPTPVGPVPRNLEPVFCTARPLRADGELSAEIREALEQSRVLVVVCSPRAAQSREVAEEVRYFKKLGRERVLALVVAGVSGTEDECMPETLQFDVRRDGTVDTEWRVRPVAADARLENGEEGYTSGRALEEALKAKGVPPREAQQRGAAYESALETAKLIIIAGVLGVPLPELASRTAPTAQPAERPAPLRGGGAAARRPGDPPPDWAARPGPRPGPPPPPRSGFGWVVPLFFLLLAAGAGWYAWQAEQKRRDADDARHRADNTIAWMQRDLSEKLITTNNVTLMADVNERLLQYFQFAAAQGDTQTAVPALADSLAVAADIALARAAYPQAMEYARQTIQVREKAIAARGAADELEVRLLGDYRRLTRALDKAGRKTEALAQAEVARKKVKEVLSRRGNDVEVLRHAALAEYEQGDLLLASARLEEAQRSFESGLVSARQLAAGETGNLRYQQDLADGTVKLGDVHQRRNDAAAAIEQYRAALKILEPLATANPDLMEVQSALAGIHARLGGVFAVQRVFADSADEYRKAVDILEVLAAKQPSNTETQLEYASSLRRLAESTLLTGPENKLEALTLLQRALDHVTRHLPDQTSPRVMALRTEIERVKTEAMK